MRIGIDIGGTKIEAVAIDEDLDVLAEFRGPVRPGPSGVTAGTIEAVDEVSRRAGGRVESIGIGVPGAIRRGVVHHARNLSIESLDLESAVAATTDACVRVSNDVNAAALGAWALGGGVSTSFAYLNLGKVKWKSALDEIKRSLNDPVSTSEFAGELEMFMALFNSLKVGHLSFADKANYAQRKTLNVIYDVMDWLSQGRKIERPKSKDRTLQKDFSLGGQT